jgi:hypothetical protein
VIKLDYMGTPLNCQFKQKNTEQWGSKILAFPHSCYLSTPLLSGLHLIPDRTLQEVGQASALDKRDIGGIMEELPIRSIVYFQKIELPDDVPLPASCW